MEQSLGWTGERLVTSIKSIGAIEHLHRYAFALEFVENKNILDIASGEGYGSNLLSNNAKYVIGVDISEEAISHASKKYKKENLSFRVGSVSDIPIDDSCIDIVVSFETIEHIYEQDEMINEIKRVLKPDGILLISSPEKSNYEDVNDDINHFHVKELYFAEFENLLKSKFSYCKFLFQKQIYGTIIIPEMNIDKYLEYTGNYDNINSTNKLIKPIFNICIASNNELPNLPFSFFDASVCYYDELIFERNRIKNTRTYKIGKFLTLPFHLIRKILKL